MKYLKPRLVPQKLHCYKSWGGLLESNPSEGQAGGAQELFTGFGSLVLGVTLQWAYIRYELDLVCAMAWVFLDYKFLDDGHKGILIRKVRKILLGDGQTTVIIGSEKVSKEQVVRAFIEVLLRITLM